MGFFTLTRNRVLVAQGCEISSTLLSLLELYMGTLAVQNKVRPTGRKSGRVIHIPTMEPSSYKAIDGGLNDLH